MSGEIIEERGVVRSVCEGKVQVEIERPACEKSGSCGICSLGSSGNMVVEVETDLPLTEGEEVALQIEQPPMLYAVFFVFVLPVIGLLVGLAVGTALFGPWGVLLGVALPVVAYIAILRYDRYLRRSHKAVVRIVTDDG